MTIRIKKPVSFKRNQKITAKNVLRYDPRYLFRNNEVGVWYDPSDMTTLFQDAAGTTPVTAVEQPVGLVLDKSRGLVLGSEQIVNGSFSADVSWEKPGGATISGGVAVLDSTSVTQGLTQSRSFALGRTYLVSMTWTGRISAGMGAYGSGDVRFVNNSTAGSFTGYVNLNAGTGASFWVLCPTGNTATIDNISVRELPGNHLSQSTSTARPVLSARVNLLTRTEQFDNAAWAKSAATVSAAQKLVVTNGQALTAGFTSQDATKLASAISYTASVGASIAGYNRIILFIHDGASTANRAQVTVSLVDGSVVSAAVAFGTFSNASVLVSASGDGYRTSLTFTSGTETTLRLRIYAADSVATTSDGVSGITLNSADLRVANAGVGLPSYQRVTTATDYDTTGFPLYLKFDGTDDFLVSGTISPGSVDKAQVFAGVRKLSDAAIGMIAELSAILGNNNGACFIASGPATTAGDRYAFVSKGTTNGGSKTTSATYDAPLTNVLSGIGDISGDLSQLRINGTQIDRSTADQGTGNFGSYPLYVGRRAGTSLPFNGHLYSLIVRFSSTNLDDVRLLNTEKWVSGKTGIPYTVNIDRVLSEILFDRSENTIEDVRNSTIVSKR